MNVKPQYRMEVGAIELKPLQHNCSSLLIFLCMAPILYIHLYLLSKLVHLSNSLFLKQHNCSSLIAFLQRNFLILNLHQDRK